MLIEKHNSLTIFCLITEQDLALLTTIQPVIAIQMTHEINQRAFDLMLHKKL